MSEDKLKLLFEFANVDYSLSIGPLQTLRHVLLLKIKSSPEGIIQINGVDYIEQDIIQILDGNHAQKPQTFNDEEFWETFPELKVVSIPDGANTYFKGDKEAFLEYEYLFEAQEFLTKEYVAGLEEEIYSRIQLREFFPAAQRVTHLFAFNQETQSRISTNIKSKIHEVLTSTSESFQFLTWEPYYKMLQIVAIDDHDYLIEQYKIGQKHLGSFSYDQWSTFFKRQLTLPFDDSFKAKIDEDETNYFNENQAKIPARTYRGYSPERNDTISWRLIYFPFILPIKILFIVVTCNSGPDYSRDSQVPGNGREQMERFMEIQQRQREERIERQRQYYYNNRNTPDTTRQP